MNFTSNSIDYLSPENWSPYAELNLPCGMDSTVDLDSWLNEICGSLKLPGELCAKVLPSVENAVRRAANKTELARLDSVQIVICLSKNAHHNQGTWGFFQIEKTLRGQDPSQGAVHRISLYLYREG